MIKKTILYSIMIYLFIMSCSDDAFRRPTQQRKYQSSTAQTVTDGGGTQQNQGTQSQISTSQNRFHVIATIVSSELAARQEQEKYKNYNFTSNIFLTANKNFAISVGSWSDQAEAEAWKAAKISRGRIPESAYVTNMQGWHGPYTPTTQVTGEPYQTPKPQDPYGNAADTYIENQPATSLNGLYHLVLETHQEEKTAIKKAENFINQGFMVYVYETTQGYSITLGRPQNQESAMRLKEKLTLEHRITNSRLIQHDDKWKSLVYP